MEIIIASLLGLVWLGLNVLATGKVVRDELSEQKQKIVQVALVWLIPFIGSMVVLAVHRPTEPPTRKYYEPADSGDDFGHAGHHQRSTARLDAQDSEET